MAHTVSGEQMEDLKFTEITNGEQSRRYHFAGGATFTVPNVARIAVRPSGTHRLETTDGKKYIIPGEWIAIEVVAEKWSL
jgi:hypothetical protein